MQKLFHPKHGELIPAGNKYQALGNKVVPIFADAMGKTHELDGTEKPMDEMQKNHEKMMSEKDDTQKKSKIQEMSDEMDFEKNLAEYDQKEADREEKGRMHTEVVAEVKNASEAIVEAISDIPQTIIPEYPDHIKELEAYKNELVEAIKKNNPQEADYSPIVEAVNAIKFPEIKIPAPKDYSGLLEDIKKALPENTDLSGVIEAIQNKVIPSFPELPLTKDGRIKVEVDRISVGGGGGAGQATEAKQDDIIAAVQTGVRAIDAYAFVAYSETATHGYTFKEDASANWYIARETLATEIMDYAKGTGGYESVYVNNTSAPSGSPTFGTYAETF